MNDMGAAGSDIRDYCTLSPLDCAFIDRARAFATSVIEPNARQWEETRQVGLPAHVVAAWSASGLLGMQAAEEFGGGGASFLAKIGVVEALAQHCMPSAFALCNIQNGPFRLSREGTPAHRERYLAAAIAGRSIQCPCLSEPQSGSDFAAMRTVARKVDGGWRITGAKAWITNGVIGDIGLLYAQTDAAKGAKGIGGFLVNLRADGCTIAAPYELAVGQVIGAVGLDLSDVFVPDVDVFYAPGNGFKRALGSINNARTYVAAMACAMVARSLQIAVRYGQSRVTFGVPIVEHQGLRWSLAEIGTELEAARLLTYRAATLIETGKDAVLAAAMAKKYAVEMAVRRLPDCLQILGGEGLKRQYPIARHLMSAKIAGFVDGSTEMQNDRIGQLLARS